MKKLMLIVLGAMALATCSTKVQVEDMRIRQARFLCALNTSGVKTQDPEDLPKWFTMASTRLIKEEHHYWEDVYYGTQKPDTLILSPGEYQSLMAISPDMAAWSVENLTPFLNDDNTSLRSLTLHLNNLTEADIEKEYPGFTPLLASYLEIVPPAPALYQSSLRYTLVENELQTVTFPAQQLVQTITFRIEIQADEGLRPNRVVACVTGVPVRVEMLSGWMNMEETSGQTVFEMKKAPGSNNYWDGTVQVLGIRPSAAADISVGAGLLVVCVDAGIKHRKVMRLVNLLPYLQENPLMAKTDEEGFFKGGERITSFIMKDPLVLSSSESQHQGEEPISEWKTPDDGATDPLIDGNDTSDEEPDPGPGSNEGNGNGEGN